MRKSKYRDIVKLNHRYRISYNPLRALTESQFVFKSIEASAEIREINSIIDQELKEDFKIGGHVDFDYLLENVQNFDDFTLDANRVEGVKLCSLFIDIRNFTKRALFIDDPGVESLKEIADLKQRAISMWIKLARYYQCHIHSITGDGLMILIGGTQPEDEDEWTLGARAFLLAIRVFESSSIINEELKQLLKDKGKENYIKDNNLVDIKVGIEYSASTLMNPQGVIVSKSTANIPVGEVKATSFEVDFSAKILSFYKDARESFEGSPKYGRLLLFGEKYKELMAFNEEVSISYVNKYEKRMYDKTLSRSAYYMDCESYKDKILRIEDVAAICDVYDSSEVARASIFEIARKETKIQHGAE